MVRVVLEVTYSETNITEYTRIPSNTNTKLALERRYRTFVHSGTFNGSNLSQDHILTWWSVRCTSEIDCGKSHASSVWTQLEGKILTTHGRSDIWILDTAHNHVEQDEQSRTELGFDEITQGIE